jgi:hypothetical protein
MCQSQCVVEMAGKHAHRGDCPRLDDHEQRPSIKETPQRSESFSQVDVLPARLRHHRRKLTIAQRPDHRQDPGDDPCSNHERRRVRGSRNVGIDEKDPGADHRTGNQSG